MLRARWTWLGAALLTAGAAACGDEDGPLFPDQGNGPGGAGGAATTTGTGGTMTSSSSSSGTGGSGTGGSGEGGGSSTDPVIDLRVDTNRDGVVDLSDPADDDGEDTWDATRGAIFLANIDDDQEACPTGSGVSNAQLAACNDAADAVVNGAEDLLDLARLRVAAWPGAPADASATISVGAPGASFVRLFKESGGGFEVFDPATQEISSAELAAGVELAIEATDFVRDEAAWDGFAEITLAVEGGTVNGQPVPGGSDVVRMRVAPVLLRHHLDPARRIYVSNTGSASSQVFRQDLAEAVQASGVPEATLEFQVSDQWTQDFFETAYMAMPGAGGQKQVIHVNFRSANYGSSGTLRAAGRVVFTVLRGPDVAGAVQYDPGHPNSMDTLNSFGNTETIPPFTHEGQSYPLGRILRGRTASFYPDPSFDRMLSAQGHQAPVYIDTSWLSVAHVDETTSFVKAPTARGWALVLADPALGVQMLEQAEAAGYGGVPMFVGKQWANGADAEVTISELLDDPDVMNTSGWAVAEVDGQLQTLIDETGITEADVIRIGAIFEAQGSYAIAHVPGLVNGIYLSDTDFGPPDPHGPVINGQDIFKQQMTEAFMPFGITLHWIENWNLYHRFDGEVHCGTNTTREIPAASWWESGL